MSRQGFPSKQTLALVGFVELGVEGNVTGHDFWTPIVNATAKLAIAVAIRDSEPAETFAKMFEAGFFFCITRCLPYVSEGSRLPLKIMQPYMHGQKVIEALFSRRGDFEMFRDRRGLPKRVEAVCLAFEVNMTIARTVYISRGAVPISLCSNLKHSTSRPSYIEGGDEPLKTCSACRAVFYCSPICQEEDWRTLHKEECCVLAQKGTNLRGIKTTLGSVRTKREQLAYLKYALDSDLDIIHGKPATRKGLRVSSEGRTIRFLDFSNSPAQWPEAGSKVELDFTGIDCEWAERIDKCISGTERELLNNPDQVFIFVEGMFSLAQFRRTCVFVTMREDPNAPKEYRWEVVTSVFRER
ncbi:hypothetical protein DFP72DRAFT_347846 [Ephemerocybe angulata]|uniref:MYND-type domain-containing protein n=1 Tax=Ephemerocybe angulata TaxID=980116 RepID=A0A8H6M4A2_9AGAR|nr:hypothetical protein DFP72DRAFT_347846 [Tulosesus angulatus]